MVNPSNQLWQYAAGVGLHFLLFLFNACESRQADYWGDELLSDDSIPVRSLQSQIGDSAGFNGSQMAAAVGTLILVMLSIMLSVYLAQSVGPATTGYAHWDDLRDPNEYYEDGPVQY